MTTPPHAIRKPGNSPSCSLTYDREDQQDAADDDGDDDSSLSSTKVQHCNCVVELSNLNLGGREKEGERGKREKEGEVRAQTSQVQGLSLLLP